MKIYLYTPQPVLFRKLKSENQGKRLGFFEVSICLVKRIFLIFRDVFSLKVLSSR